MIEYELLLPLNPKAAGLKLILAMFFTRPNKRYCLNLSKVADITYSHAIKLVRLFYDSGYIIQSRNGRKVLCTLTKKGITLTLALIELKRLQEEAINASKNVIRRTK